MARRRVIVEEFLERRTAETGTHECREGNGDRPARQQNDAGHGQRRDVFDLVAELGAQDLLWSPGGFVRDSQRIVRCQDREVATLKPGGKKRRNRVAEMLPVGKRGDCLADDRK